MEFRQCGPEGGWYYPNIDPATVSWDTGLLEGNGYSGNLIQVYWHPDDADIDYVDVQDSNLGIELAKFPLLPCTRDAKNNTSHQGTVTISCKGVTIECQIVENLRFVGLEHRRSRRYSGAVKLIRAKVDFDVLVREHARQASKDLSKEHIRTLVVRPLLKREEEYQNYLKSIIGSG